MSTTNVTEDGKITKELLEEGTGTLHPAVGHRVRLHFVGTLKSDGTQFESTRNSNRALEFIVGEESKDVIKAWTYIVPTMRVHEKSKFIVSPEYAYGAKGRSSKKIPGNATLVVEVEILEDRPPEADALAKAEEYCAAGAELFKAADYQGAGAQYRMALEWVDLLYTQPVGEMKVRLWRNLSIAFGKREKWEQSLNYANKVLERQGGDPRALLRKTEAHLKLGDVEKARAALNLGLTVTKNSAPFVAMKALVEEEERRLRQEQAEVFKRMVGKKE